MGIATHRLFGFAWLAFALALAVHVLDEATHDFLSVYNPSAQAIRSRLPFLPLPTFISSHAEPFNCSTQNADTLTELVDRNKLARAMGHPNIARAEHHCLRAERNHARRFRAKGDRAGFIPS